MLRENKPSDLDAPETTIQHGRIVQNKPFLRKIYEQWYCSFLNILPGLPAGKILELGSGGGFLKLMDPRVITSDILPLPNCDMTFSAENIPFERQTVSAIFMLNVLHHIPNCRRFFSEAERVLITGGCLFMIEPANTLFARLIYKNFHHEPFDMNAKWEFPAGGPLSISNQALPSIVFQRDERQFHSEFPLLRLEKIRQHSPFRYLLTGGLSYKSLAPGWGFGFLTFAEKLLAPLYPLLALFQTITIRKI